MRELRKSSFVKSLSGIIIASSSLLLMTGCESGLPEVTPEEGETVSQLAEPAASELLRTLVGSLNAALEDGDPAGAVEFCSTQAIPLTRLVQAGLDEELEIKRTSFRFRNPANAPDEAEDAALRYFEDVQLAGRSLPSSYVQRVSETEFRYYKPLFVGEPCLQCHGAADVLDPAVTASLAERYPTDLATGYEAGDFRGVVRVSVPAGMVLQ